MSNRKSSREKLSERPLENTLSSVLSDPSKVSFILPNQLTLNYCNISMIDKIPKKYHTIENLFLSHNKISTIDNINQFEKLKNLSLGYNKIANHLEFLKIERKNQIKCLRIKGNPLEKHPNYVVEILDIFPKIDQLDDLKIGKNFRKNYKMISKTISKNIIMFLYRLEEDKNYLINLRDKLLINKEIINISKEQDLNDSKEIKELNKFITSNKKTNQKIKEKLQEKYESSCEEKLEKLYDFESVEVLERKLAGFKAVFGKDLDVKGMLQQLCEISNKVYGSYDGIVVENRNRINEIYRKLFNEVLTTMAGGHERRLEEYLVDLALEDKNIDQKKFAEDSDYAFESILYKFYQIQPIQAEMSGVICFEQKNPLLDTISPGFENNFSSLSKKQSNLTANSLSFRLNKKKEEKSNWTYRKNEIENELDLQENNPEILKNLLLIHFPIFPLNSSYLQTLHKIIFMRCEFVLKIYQEIRKILQSKKGFQIENIKKTQRSKSNRTRTEPSFKEIAQEHLDLVKEKIEHSEIVAELPLAENNKKTIKFLEKTKNNQKKKMVETTVKRQIYIEDQEKKRSNKLLKILSYIFKRNCFEKLRKNVVFSKKMKLSKQKGLIKLCSTLKKAFQRKFFFYFVRRIKTKRKEETLRILQTSRFFDILLGQVKKQKKELELFVRRNILSKVFFGMISLIYKKRTLLKKIIKKTQQKILKKKRNSFAEWRLWTINQLCNKWDTLKKIKNQQKKIVEKQLKNQENSLNFLEEHYFSKNLQIDQLEDISTKETKDYKGKYIKDKYYLSKINKEKENLFEYSKENSRFLKEFSKEFLSKDISKDSKYSKDFKYSKESKYSKDFKFSKDYSRDYKRNSWISRDNSQDFYRKRNSIRNSRFSKENSNSFARNKSSLERTRKKINDRKSTAKRKRVEESPIHCLDKCYFRKCSACYYQSYELKR